MEARGGSKDDKFANDSSVKNNDSFGNDNNSFSHIESSFFPSAVGPT